MKSERYQTNARRSFHPLDAMEVAVVSAGLHILSSLRAGPSVRVVFNYAASIGVRQN